MHYAKKTWSLTLAFLLFASAFFTSFSTAEANQPDITRGEFLKELVTTIGVDLKEVKELPFTDVDAELAPYVEAALRLGITTGKTSTSFGPNEKITREQAFVFLIRALNLRDSYSTKNLKSFKDVKAIGEWSKDEIAAAVQLGLLTGYPDKTFKPNQPISSKQVTTILERYRKNFERITLIHTNDTHGRIVNNTTNTELGFAKIAKIVNDVRSTNPNTLLLDMGDTFHGTTTVNLNQGLVVAEVLNGMKYDAMVPGNHDFNYGQDHLLALKDKLQFPIVSGNIIKDGKPFLPAYTIKTVNGKKIALIGLTATDTAVKTSPSGIKGISFQDEVTRTKEIVKELEGQVDNVVVLSHSGLATDENIANQVAGVDVILGGHSHDTLETPKKFTHAYVTQAFEYGKALGQTNLIYFNDKLVGVNGFLFLDNASKTEDTHVAAIIKPYVDKSNETLKEVIATVNVKLDGEREDVRTKETNLGNAIADAMRVELGTDVALTNGGGIRASIPQGDVTRNHVLTTLPFDNTLVKTTLTGAELKRALEHGVRLYPEQNGGFAHVSGLKFKFDPTKPAYERTYDIFVNGETLNLEKTYTVATNNFTAVGGDGYDMFKEEKIEFNSGELLSTVFIKYLQNTKVLPVVENRIQLVQ